MYASLQVFLLSQVKKESVPDVVLQHYQSATMILDTRQVRWLTESWKKEKIFLRCRLNLLQM